VFVINKMPEQKYYLAYLKCFIYSCINNSTKF